MNMSLGRSIALGVGAVTLVLVLIFAGKLVEHIDADEILIVQSPFAGTLTWHTSAGVKGQWFGTTTIYKKRSMFAFDEPIDEELELKDVAGKVVSKEKRSTCRKGITVRFNDGGHGVICGSIQYEMPLDPKSLTEIHTRFGSQEAVQKQLIETVANKSVYLSGPLMSSRESYAEKRSNLIHFVEDRIENGVYKTYQRDGKIKDAITGQEKNVTLVEIAMADGKPERQEEAVLGKFGIKAFNFTIRRLPYDPEVESQIKQQQQIAMDVQTSIAAAKKAEQYTITVAEQGKANAATAKWEQEVLKAKAVTEAQQKLEVATLDAQAAAQFKRAETLRGEGEAARRKLVMEADGALALKIEAYKEVNKNYADAIKDYQGSWVPSVSMGSGSGANLPGGAATALIDLLTAKTAKELGLDMGTKGTKNAK